MATRIDRVVSSGVLVIDSTDSTDSTDHDNGAISRQVENNTWIVGDDEEVIVIDPAHDAAAVLDAVGDREVLAVICTHGHADHVTAALDVAQRDEAPIALHPDDQMTWREVHPEDDPEIDMADGGVFEVADVRLEVLHTPGHSRGAVCIYWRPGLCLSSRKADGRYHRRRLRHHNPATGRARGARTARG